MPAQSVIGIQPHFITFISGARVNKSYATKATETAVSANQIQSAMSIEFKFE
jgi:hypothetical protein